MSKRTRKLSRPGWLTVSLAVVGLAVGPALANDYATARTELIAAYQAGDFAAMVTAAERALQARPGYPGAMFNLALAQALNDDAAASLATLRQLAARGVDYAADEADEFAALRALPQWEAYALQLATLRAPVGSTEVALQLAEDRFVPEGIAIDGDGAILLGSIHTGRLLRARDAVETLSDGAGHWSVFGMRFHDDGGLWFASAAVPQLAGVGEERGRTGLFRIDPASGELTVAAVLPQQADEQVLGDLLVVGNSIYTTDSLTGAVYRYDIESGRYRQLLEPGRLGSPQGLVMDAAQRHLYVADYIGGLYRVSLGDGGLTRLEVPSTLTDYGIDGLYRYGAELIAIQNGVRPHRVVALRLGDDGVSITGSRLLAANLPQFDEPTLGVVQGDDFYFVANSHWNRFTADHTLPDGLSGPIVLRLSLTAE